MIGDDIKQELSEEKYNHYLELLDLLDKYERGPKESYDDIVNNLLYLEHKVLNMFSVFHKVFNYTKVQFPSKP